MAVHRKNWVLDVDSVVNVVGAVAVAAVVVVVVAAVADAVACMLHLWMCWDRQESQ